MISTIQEFFQRHYVLLLTGFFILSGGYLLITEFWYFGTAQFFLSEKNTVITLKNKGKYDCPEKQCSFEISPGTYSYEVKKENFEPMFGKIIVPLQGKGEQKIILKHSTTQLHITQNFQKKKRYFPLTNTGKKKVPQPFTIQDNLLYYQKTPILHLSSTRQNMIQISSNEVGRGYWIIDPKGVQEFEPTSQNITQHIRRKASQSEISGFLALQDGSFIFESAGNFFWKKIQQKAISLAITPISPAAFCKTGKHIITIEKTANGIEVEEYSINTQKKISWGILDNFPKDHFDALQCFGNSKAIIFFQDRKKYPTIVIENN